SRKGREAVKLHSISIFGVKSALNSANNQMQILNPVQHFPLHSAPVCQMGRKNSISGKELH
ncbi:MAG: hypothetical protein KDC52_20580, partial [Ignavibacteriae bacterium]|nr:hypothetical protein [Ignavibacteriota bacterium]